MAILLRTSSTISDQSTHENDTLEKLIQRRLRSLPGDDLNTTVTIFRVPAHVRDANKLLYEPRMVSIGPYYRGREELCAMEQLKMRYLRDFRKRGIGDQIPKFCYYIQAIRDVEERARRSYYEQTKLMGIGNEASVRSDPCGSSQQTEQGQSDGFAEMLLIDGCFILEFLFKNLEKDADSLQSLGWGVDLINSDLLLLENQIPFFVLVSLYSVLFIGREPIDGIPMPTPKDQLVNDLLLSLFRTHAFLQEEHAPPTVRSVEIHHLLHLYHEAYLPNPEPRNIQPGDNSISGHPDEENAPGGNSAEAQAQNNSMLDPQRLPCTTQLREAGVLFKRKESPKHLFDITFSNGVMEIPHLEIDHVRAPLLVNLIAFEQCMGKKGADAPLRSYTALMTALVSTGKDVELLQKYGIINNMLSSEDDTAMSYFNQLAACSTLDYQQHYFVNEFAELNKHYNSKWNKYKAKFRREYCANPWSIVSFLVAVVVFSFGISQLSIALYRLRHRKS